jgi:hypothetical protein
MAYHQMATATKHSLDHFEGASQMLSAYDSSASTVAATADVVVHLNSFEFYSISANEYVVLGEDQHNLSNPFCRFLRES